MIQASTSILDQVDGSSQVECSATKVICSVTGPVEPKARQELPTQLALEIVVRPSKGVPNTREKLMEDKIRGVLTPVLVRYLYPRQLCQLTFQVLESGESEEQYTVKELGCCINAAYLALVDAGIALKSSFVSVPICILEQNKIVTNPTAHQLAQSVSTHLISMEVGSGGTQVENVLLVDSNGDFQENQLFDVLAEGEKECINIASAFRKIIQEKLQKDFIWKQ